MLSKELLVQTFVDHFRVRGAAATVHVKAIHLRTMVRSALNRCGADPSKRDGLRMVYFHLQKLDNACRRVGRSSRSLKGVANGRVEQGSLLMMEYFGTFISKCRACLDGIMRTFEEESRNRNGKLREVQFTEDCRENGALSHMKLDLWHTSSFI